MAVLRECRVVGHRAYQPEPAEPAIGEVEVHILAQAVLGADTEAEDDEQHADHQFEIDRRAARRARAVITKI